MPIISIVRSETLSVIVTLNLSRFSGKPCLPADANPGDVYDVEDADPTAAFNPVCFVLKSFKGTLRVAFFSKCLVSLLHFEILRFLQLFNKLCVNLYLL